MNREDYVEHIIGVYGGRAAIAERVASALATRGPMKKSDISRLLSGNLPARVFDEVLAGLYAAGRVRYWRERYTGGGPRTIWSLT